MNSRARRFGIAGLLLLAVGAGCGVGNLEVADGSRRKGIDLSVGNIDIGRDCTIEGDVSLAAGNVVVGEGTVVSGEVSVTHGNVELERNVQAGGVMVKNGVVDLDEGVRVSGGVTLHNGVIDLRGTSVAGPVKLTRGRLEVGAGTDLDGGIEVHNPGRAMKDSTYVVIKTGARVAGLVNTSGVVRLRIAPGADVTAAEFKGNSPEILE